MLLEHNDASCAARGILVYVDPRTAVVQENQQVIVFWFTVRVVVIMTAVGHSVQMLQLHMLSDKRFGLENRKLH